MKFHITSPLFLQNKLKSKVPAYFLSPHAQLTNFEVFSSFSQQLFQGLPQLYGLRSYLSFSSFSYAVTLKL